MLGVRGERDDAVLAEPRAQAIDERHDDGVALVAGEQVEVVAADRRGVGAGERDRLDRRRQRDAREPLAQHGVEMRDAARRRARREAQPRRPRADARVLVALVRERDVDARGAEPARQEPCAQRVHQAVDGEAQRLGIVHRRRQREPAREARRRHVRRARVGHAAERAVDERGQCGTAAARQRVARQCAKPRRTSSRRPRRAACAPPRRRRSARAAAMRAAPPARRRRTAAPRRPRARTRAPRAAWERCRGWRGTRARQGRRRRGARAAPRRRRGAGSRGLRRARHRGRRRTPAA